MQKTYRALRPVYINHTDLAVGDTIEMIERAAQFHIADGTLQEVTKKTPPAKAAESAKAAKGA